MVELTNLATLLLLVAVPWQPADAGGAGPILHLDDGAVQGSSNAKLGVNVFHGCYGRRNIIA